MATHWGEVTLALNPQTFLWILQYRSLLHFVECRWGLSFSLEFPWWWTEGSPTSYLHSHRCHCCCGRQVLFSDSFCWWWKRNETRLQSVLLLYARVLVIHGDRDPSTMHFYGEGRREWEVWGRSQLQRKAGGRWGATKTRPKNAWWGERDDKTRIATGHEDAEVDNWSDHNYSLCIRFTKEHLHHQGLPLAHCEIRRNENWIHKPIWTSCDAQALLGVLFSIMRETFGSTRYTGSRGPYWLFRTRFSGVFFLSNPWPAVLWIKFHEQSSGDPP